jgi:hypothetical protein
VIFLGDEFGLKTSTHRFKKEMFETVDAIARMIEDQ